MSTVLDTSTLDAILAVQLFVAWAGEGRCEPRRLGWWDTDLVDFSGGGDFFRRLLPRTREWAALEAVREAARRSDAQSRRKMADPDGMRTLFFLGFELDERLGERLATLKREARSPLDALSFPTALDASFSRGVMEQLFGGIAREAISFTIVPGGRLLKGATPASPVAMVQQLAAALIPIPDQYPLPFFKVSA